jgi:hypothetical protein
MHYLWITVLSVFLALPVVGDDVVNVPHPIEEDTTVQEGPIEWEPDYYDWNTGEPIYDTEEEEAVYAMQDTRQLRKKTNIAMEAIFRLAVFKLRVTGHKKEADKIWKEWKGTYSGMVMRVGRDLGDHAPLSTWIAATVSTIEFILGTQVCEWLHLDDLKIINFAIPVVFSCIDNVDTLEYALHFIPFSGVVGYWTAFGTCVGLTYGIGFMYVCGPIGMGAEYLITTFAAPLMSEGAHNLFCGGNYASLATKPTY